MSSQPPNRRPAPGAAANGGSTRTRPSRQSAHRPARKPGPNPAFGREPRPSLFLPMAVKFALLTGLLLVVFMAYLGQAAYQLALATAEREINDKGTKIACLLSASVQPRFVGEAEDRNLDGLESELSSFLRSPGASGVLDILLLNVAGDALFASATGARQISLERGRPIASSDAERAGVAIAGGTLSDARTPIRSYERQVLASRAGVDVPVAKIRVYLSAEAIAELKDGLQDSVLGTSTVAALAGIFVVILMGGLLTRPVRRLKQDMAAVAMGDLQHQSVIRSGDEIEQLAHAFNRMTAHLAEAQDLEASRKALERELSIATRIQTALLPREIPELPGYDLATHYEAAREVGGDYYDLVSVGENRTAIVVADVSGKGIPGSLVMTMTRSLVRMAASEGAEPGEILQRVNASLSRDMTRGMFVTLIYVELDAATGVIKIARAGHNPAYLYRARKQKLFSVQPDGLALAMDPGPVFSSVLQVKQVQLEPGDCLTLYTDGVIEAMDPENNEYTPERFMKLLTEKHDQPAQGIVASVLEDLEAHTRGAEPSDDVTLLVLKRDE